MTVLGHWVVVAACVASGIAAVLYGRQAWGGSQGSPRGSLFLTLATAGIVVASGLLLALFLGHDFSNAYVFSYSDRSLPLHFLISCFYAGQEGSFLFWALCSSIIALVLRNSVRKHDAGVGTLSVFLGVQTLLLGLVLAKSPFRALAEVFPQAAGQLPADGRGLNPLLQNFWMVIHPPVLFLGFAAMAVPFSVAVAGLVGNDRRLLVRLGLPWVLFATGVLALGIMLGAYWAYGVLGWGGYWGWDPVENSSLVPWLTGVALLHTLLAQLRTGKFVRTNLALALVTFFLVMYSTFLTRSGILGDASVHSFTDPGALVYWMLLGTLALLGAVSLGFLLLRWRAMAPEHSDAQFLSRESLLGAGAIVLLLSAAVILFGTSLPIASTTRVEPSFYDTTNLPIAIAIVVLIGVSLFSQWESEEPRRMFRRMLRAFAISVVTGVVLFLLGARDLGTLALLLGCLFAIVVNVEMALTVARGDWRFLGGKIAHAGIAVFLLGVVGPGRYSTVEHVALQLNTPTPVPALGRTFTFTGGRVRADGKTAFAVTSEREGEKRVLEPVMFATDQQGIMKNPDIASFLTSDLYLSPVSFEQPEVSGETFTIVKGQAVKVEGGEIRFVSFAMGGGEHASMTTEPDGSVRVGTVLEVTGAAGRETLTPYALIHPGKGGEYTAVRSQVLGAEVKLAGMNIGGGTSSIDLTVDRGMSHMGAPVLMVEASIKPMIVLVWIGTVVMLGGFALALGKRSREKVR